MYAKLKEKYQIKANESLFPLYNIGPAIAKLLSAVENEKYSYQVIDYHGINYYRDYTGIGKIDYNGTCFVVSKKDFSLDNNKLLEDNCVGDFNKGKETICLSTCGFNIPPVVCDEHIHRVPKTDKFESYIQFYNNQDKKLIFIPEFPYIYEFINMAIDKKVGESKKILSMTDYDELIDDFIKKYQKEDELKLSRGKNNGK